MDRLSVDLIHENINNKISFKRNFEFNSNDIIKIEKFIIDRNFKYLNVKLNPFLEVNPYIFVYLIDPNNILRLQYLSVNSKNDLVIGEDKQECSIGGYPGTIYKGEWKLVIANLKKSKEKINYTITIEGKNQFINEEIDRLGEESWVHYDKKDGVMSINNYDWNKSFLVKSKWYKGDFHTHSILSDGKMNDEVYMTTAKAMNLDFVVITEHNIIPTGWNENEKILVIPGMEITLEDGHFNILGIRKFPIEFDLIDKIRKQIEMCSIENIDTENYENEIQETIVKAILCDYRDEKSIYSVNHMMLEFWKWKFQNIRLDKIDTIEICNDPTYYLGPKSNDKVIKMLDILWDDGYRIYGIGGSDAHILPNETYDNSDERSIIGDPATFVYCDELTPNNVIDSVRQGHIYVSRGITLDISIEVTCHNEKKSYLPGDKIEICDYGIINYSINIGLENMINSFGSINATTMPLKVYFIENGKILKKIISEDKNINFTTKWNKEDFKYIRVEIRDMDDKFKGYINPIYSGSKKHQLITFKDLFDKYNQIKK